jgi:hypothetical protein
MTLGCREAAPQRHFSHVWKDGGVKTVEVLSCKRKMHEQWFRAGEGENMAGAKSV